MMLNNIFNMDVGSGYWNWLLPLVIVDLVLKGISLWKAARNTQKGWFVALLVVNTVGILPIIYLLFFEKKKKK